MSDTGFKLAKENRSPQQKFLSDVLSVVSVVFAALLLSTIITTYFLFTVAVEGDSMYDTLQNGQTVWITKLFRIERDDIVIFPWEDGYYKKNEPLIKRVVGVEGDTILLENGTVYRMHGGQKEMIVANFSDPSLAYNSYKKTGKKVTEVTVGAGEVYVMGDNYNNSYDSTDFGPIPRGIISGKALFVK